MCSSRNCCRGLWTNWPRSCKPIAADSRLSALHHTVTLVDGTLLKALPRIAEAMWLTTRTGTRHHAWRLHTQFELDKHVPVQIDLTNGRNSQAVGRKERAAARTCSRIDAT